RSRCGHHLLQGGDRPGAARPQGRRRTRHSVRTRGEPRLHRLHRPLFQKPLTAEVSATPLSIAIEAARAAGKLLRDEFGATQDVHAFEAHDIKLELDVRSQNLITEILLRAFPDHAILGEEGIAGNPESRFQWIVDPIDGTVNYFYGLP